MNKLLLRLVSLSLLSLLSAASFNPDETVSIQIALLRLVALTFLSAQLPTCVSTCYGNIEAATFSCDSTDVMCLCSNATFQSALIGCLETGCVRDFRFVACSHSANRWLSHRVVLLIWPPVSHSCLGLCIR